MFIASIRTLKSRANAMQAECLFILTRGILIYYLLLIMTENNSDSLLAYVVFATQRNTDVDVSTLRTKWSFAIAVTLVANGWERLVQPFHFHFENANILYEKIRENVLYSGTTTQKLV